MKPFDVGRLCFFLKKVVIKLLFYTFDHLRIKYINLHDDPPRVVSVTSKNVGARCSFNFLAIFAYLSLFIFDAEFTNEYEFK